MAATRDEVLEALWPDLAPDTAGNSLHQTIYFLRRVFEPDYREGLSAGYVTYDGEVVALSECALRQPQPTVLAGNPSNTNGRGALVELLELYRGRFALDFSYEDWAGDYRDNLHAAVLGAAETGIERRLQLGDFEAAHRSWRTGSWPSIPRQMGSSCCSCGRTRRVVAKRLLPSNTPTTRPSNATNSG